MGVSVHYPPPTAGVAPPDKKGETLALSRQVGDMGFAVGAIPLPFLTKGRGGRICLRSGFCVVPPLTFEFWCVEKALKIGASHRIAEGRG